jgi:hypothetical protein
MNLKQNCLHFKNNHDFGKQECHNIENDNLSTLTIYPDGDKKGQKIYYRKCMAKYCPIIK